MSVIFKKTGEDTQECYFDSSNVFACKYNTETRKLAIIFTKGHQYLYEGVLPYHYQRFINSVSTAFGLRTYIAANYTGSKISNILSAETMAALKEQIKNEQR